MDCYAKYDFYTPYWAVTISTLLILVLAALFHRLLPLCLTRFFPDLEHGVSQRIRSAIVKLTAIFMYYIRRMRSSSSSSVFLFTVTSMFIVDYSFSCRTVFYPAISLKSLILWNCTRVGEVSYITDDLSLPCEGAAYTRASAFNVVFVVGVVIGWPSFLIWCGIACCFVHRLFVIIIATSM